MLSHGPQFLLWPCAIHHINQHKNKEEYGIKQAYSIEETLLFAICSFNFIGQLKNSTKIVLHNFTIGKFYHFGSIVYVPTDFQILLCVAEKMVIQGGPWHEINHRLKHVCGISVSRLIKYSSASWPCSIWWRFIALELPLIIYSV
jgi:hypothetical protein